MSKFDESLPHAVTWGIGGIQGYEQDGKHYNAKKQLVSAAEPVVEPVVEVVDEVVDEQEDKPDYEGMHWSALKKLVEARGGVWIDKQAAITFLEG